VVIPAGCAQINFNFTGNQLPLGGECTLGLDVSGGSPSPTACATAVAADFVADILPNLCSTVTLTSVRCKFGPDNTGPFAEVAVGTNGSVGGSGTSPAVCYLIHKSTDDGGRAGRGRMYLPGVAEANVGGDGNLTALTISNFDSDFASFIVKLNADGNVPMLLHGAASPLTIPSEITVMSCDGRAATQRRRQRR